MLVSVHTITQSHRPHRQTVTEKGPRLAQRGRLDLLAGLVCGAGQHGVGEDVRVDGVAEVRLLEFSLAARSGDGDAVV